MSGPSRGGSLTTALDSAFRAAANADAAQVPHLLLGVLDGLETAVNTSRWDTQGVCQSLKLLSRMPAGASTRLAVRGFTNNSEWRRHFLNLGENLSDWLRRREPDEQRELATAWVAMAQWMAEDDLAHGGADKHARRRNGRSLRSLQQGVSDFMHAGGRLAFDEPGRAAISRDLMCLLDLADAVERGLGAAEPSAEDGSWSRRPLLPSGPDLDPYTEPQLEVNRVGEGEAYDSADQYLRTHFSLVREDFVRPLRLAVGAAHEAVRKAEERRLAWDSLLSEELPREVKHWPSARLLGAVVGEPGGVLHTLRLASDEDERDR